jgi:hypothetical protein
MVMLLVVVVGWGKGRLAIKEKEANSGGLAPAVVAMRGALGSFGESL